MYYTGIDLHKFTSYLTTVDSSGNVVKQADIRNIDHTVESTMTWYWLNDLLTSMNIPLVLAHAKYVKAIAYAKVKTDKVDSHTLAQLLRMDYISVTHKIYNDKRLLRKKSKQIAQSIVAKEIAEILYHVLKNKSGFNNKLILSWDNIILLTF